MRLPSDPSFDVASRHGSGRPLTDCRHPARQSRLLQTLRAFMGAFTLLGTSGCSTLVTSVDHKESTWENADLWRRMKNDPPVFQPMCLPAGSVVSPKTGDWVVGPNDHAAFFVPKESCGGLSPAMWRAEAQKGVNQFSRRGRAARNGATALVLLPLLPLLPLAWAYDRLE